MKQTKMMKKNYEFKNVLSKGKYYSGRNIEAFIKTGKQEGKINQLGIAVSVKVAKAVKRNHIKRRIRESYRIQEDQMKKGNSIVILWKKKADIQNATFQNIQKDLKHILDKANLIKEE